ncbi:MAG TPA: hemerythrin domain-containing protein [Thermoanaerobaculia bacterium]|nr:hemerythrin domain-containing protein [Thermoanaerobaculia bacterium]
MIDLSVSAGMLAASNPRLRGVLEDLGIDYCCSEDRTVQDVAAAAGVTVNDLEAAIGLASEEAPAPHEAWLEESLSALIAHLEVGHATKAAAVSRISTLFEMVAPATSRQVAFGVLRAAFHELIIELMPHTQREEIVIFPFVLAMESAGLKGTPLPDRPQGGLEALLHPLSGEHRQIQAALAKMRSAALDLHVHGHDEFGRRLVSELRDLSREVHEFMNLETFVLFPRAMSLEARLYAEPAIRQSPAQRSAVTSAV